MVIRNLIDLMYWLKEYLRLLILVVYWSKNLGHECDMYEGMNGVIDGCELTFAS